MKKRRFLATSSALTALSAIGLVFFVSLHDAQAGPITNGGGNPPFTKLGVYQGVIAIVPGSVGDSVMEIGNTGRDIKSTGSILLVPGAAGVTSAGLSLSSNFTASYQSHLVAGVNSGAYLSFGTNGVAAPSDTSGGWKIRLHDNVGDKYGLGIAGGNLWQKSSGTISFYTGGYTERVRIDGAGNVGIGVGAVSPTSILDLNGALTVRQMAAPGVPLAADNRGRIYYDSTSKKFRVSEGGGAYVNLVGGTPPIDLVLQAGNTSSRSLGLGRGDITPASPLVINKGLTAANNGDANNGISIIADSTNSALYSQQDGAGWAGYFSGRAFVRDSINLGNRTKSKWRIEVCDVGADTCLGQFLYTTGTTANDNATTGIKYWYARLQAGAWIPTSVLVFQVVPGGDWVCEFPNNQHVVDRGNSGHSLYEASGCPATGPEFTFSQPFGSGKACIWNTQVIINWRTGVNSNGCQLNNRSNSVFRVESAQLVNTFTPVYELR